MADFFFTSVYAFVQERSTFLYLGLHATRVRE